MNEEKQKIFDNFMDLNQEILMESDYKENLSILREAWGIEIDKPGCSQCIKNAAQNKYSAIGYNLIEHELTIEQAKQVNDMRAELNKEHQEVQNKINNQVDAEIQRLKSKNPSEPPKIPSSKNSDSAFNPFENQ